MLPLKFVEIKLVVSIRKYEKGEEELKNWQLLISRC
jgi:hypothetical protein